MPFAVRISDPRAKFAASHFLFNHDKCSRLHGHNYTVSVEIQGPLNDSFFVVDFFEIKKKLLQFTEEIDHAVLLPTKCSHCKIERRGTQIHVKMGEKDYEFPAEDCRLLPLEATTSELLARYLYEKIKAEYPTYQIHLSIGESEGSMATYFE